MVVPMTADYKQFCQSGTDETHAIDLTGTRLSESSEIIFNRTKTGVSVTIEHKYDGILEASEDVTALFAEATSDDSLYETLYAKHLDFSEDHEHKLHMDSVAAGESREDYGDVLAQLSQTDCGKSVHFDRGPSGGKGASTRLRFTRSKHDRETPRVSVQFLWDGKIRATAKEADHQLTSRFRRSRENGGGGQGFSAYVEKMHDLWEGSCRKHGQARAVKAIQSMIAGASQEMSW